MGAVNVPTEDDDKGISCAVVETSGISEKRRRKDVWSPEKTVQSTQDPVTIPRREFHEEYLFDMLCSP